MVTAKRKYELQQVKLFMFDVIATGVRGEASKAAHTKVISQRARHGRESRSLDEDVSKQALGKKRGAGYLDFRAKSLFIHRSS